MSKPVSFSQGAQAPDNPFTQHVTTGPAFTASPSVAHYSPSPSTAAWDILAVSQRHVAFVPNDHSITNVAALSGATRETYLSRDKTGVENEE